MTQRVSVCPEALQHFILHMRSLLQFLIPALSLRTVSRNKVPNGSKHFIGKKTLDLHGAQRNRKLHTRH